MTSYNNIPIENLENIHRETTKLYEAAKAIAMINGGGLDPFYSNVWMGCNITKIDRVAMQRHLVLMKNAIDKHNEDAKRIREINDVIAHVTDEANSLRQEINGLKSEINGLQKEIADYNVDIQNLIIERETLQRKINGE